MKKNIYKIILLFLAILSIVLFLAPILTKNYLVKNSKNLIGTQIEIEDLKYNYFTSVLSVCGLKIFECENTNELITLDTLLLNLAPLKLLNNNLTIEELYVSGLNVKAVLKDSIFNFDTLLNFYTQPDVSITSQETETNPLVHSISNIAFKHSSFLFDNQDIESKLGFKDISFIVPHIVYGGKAKSNGSIKFNFDNGGYVESELSLNTVSGDFDAHVILEKLELSPFYKYVLDYANINSLKGALSSNIHLKGNTSKISEAIVSGKVDVHDFVMTDTNDQKILGADTIKAQLYKIDYAHNSYEIDSLSLSTPYVYFNLDSVTNNMFRIFKLYPDKVVANLDSIAAKSQPDLFYKIAHLKLNKGILDYSDNFTGDVFDYHLSDIEINSDNLSSTSEMLDISSKMLLNNRGTLDAHVQMDPLDFMNGTINFRIENFLLSDVNIYSKHYTGHNIIKGDFYYYSHSDLVNGKIKSTNKLLVKNVSVKSDKKGLYQLPLKFALFLLKDKDGNVNLDIPVKGDLNDPKVNMGKLVWSTFKNLMIKVVASPVKFLASLVGVNPKEMTEIKFNYLDTILSGAQKKKLNKLIDLENKKEGLKIDLLYGVDEHLQQQEIAKQEVDKMYFKAKQKHYLKDKENFKKYVFDKTGLDSLSIEESVAKLTENLNLAAISKRYSDLKIKKTYAYLKLRNDFTQIKISKQDTTALIKKAKLPKFDIKYAVE